jgi:hypothetical protein
MLRLPRFQRGKHLILASREGGDIPVLLALGVKPKNIVAVEVNPDAALAVQDKYPKVKVECGDVVDVARFYKKKLVSAFLDFCSPVRPFLITKVTQTIIYGLSDGAIIGCAFLNGREKDPEVRKDIAGRKAALQKILNSYRSMSNQELVLEYLIHFTDAVYPHFKSAEEATNPELGMLKQEFMDDLAKQVREILKEIEDSSTSMAALARTMFVTHELISEGTRYKCAPLTQLYISYNSNTRKSKGIPMFIVVGRVIRALPGKSIAKFKRRFNHSNRDFGEGMYGINCDISEEELRNGILAEIDLMEFEGVDSSQLHMMFNISKGTMAAWKACRTRGAYG